MRLPHGSPGQLSRDELQGRRGLSQSHSINRNLIALNTASYVLEHPNFRMTR